MLSLNDYCHEKRVTPGVVKIDVEGWELSVLKGAAHLFSLPETIILVEMHPYAWYSAGHNDQPVNAFF